MKKNESWCGKHLFKCENGYVKSKFKLGDVVRVIDKGWIYATYKSAFEFFKILNKSKKTGDYYHLDYNYDFETNWIICGIGIHSHSDDIVYHIINNKKQHMIIGEFGIENRNIERDCYDPLVMQNKDLFIYKIPKSYE